MIFSFFKLQFMNHESQKPQISIIFVTAFHNLYAERGQYHYAQFVSLMFLFLCDETIRPYV